MPSTHVPRDSHDKPVYRCGYVHRKQVCVACNWEREYSMPIDSGNLWIYGEWQPPDHFKKPAGPAGDRR